MRRRIPVNSIAMAMCALWAGSCAGGTRTQSGPTARMVAIENIEIGGKDLAALEGQSIAVRAKVTRTEYGSFALYPKGKIEGESDAGKCVDLVYSKTASKLLRRKDGKVTTLTGHFVLLDALPDYTASLEIEGLRHTPVCQIFADVEPYPYFVVESVR